MRTLSDETPGKHPRAAQPETFASPVKLRRIQVVPRYVAVFRQPNLIAISHSTKKIAICKMDGTPVAYVRAVSAK
jgi:hypothetical protein